MAGKRRHWKEKNGRFWARIAVPKHLQSIFGKSELIEPLGGDLRIADRNHAAAVARLQTQIANADHHVAPEVIHEEAIACSGDLTAEDLQDLAWKHYTSTLEQDDHKPATMPTPQEIDDEREKLMQRIDMGDADIWRNPIGLFNVYTDFELKAGARHFDTNLRTRRLSALEASLASGDTRFVDVEVQQYVDHRRFNVVKGSHVWRDLATQITRAQIDALKQTLRRDKGNYAMQALDPILKPPTSSDRGLTAVPLKLLFQSYIVKSQALGTHRDGGASWKYPLDSLIKFLGHSDARRITGQNLLDWRDSLLASGKSAKTVSDKYLAAIRAVLTWAFTEKRLPSNEADTVHQKVGKKIHSRERGYTKPEAVEILKVTTNYQPTKATNPSNRESEHITRAKRWVPLLCAFTGARVTEMTQLRKEDIRQEDDRWILRVTPDAGSVKTGHYRDVPLHSQILDLGFIEFLRTVQAGPLFHRAQRPEAFVAGARATSGRLSEWLQSRNLVPEGVQPSYGWRHRFKTHGRELGMSDRVLDAIQGHASRTSGDDYGDITILARSRMIDALPSYDLGR